MNATSVKKLTKMAEMMNLHTAIQFCIIECDRTILEAAKGGINNIEFKFGITDFICSHHSEISDYLIQYYRAAGYVCEFIGSFMISVSWREEPCEKNG